MLAVGGRGRRSRLARCVIQERWLDVELIEDIAWHLVQVVLYNEVSENYLPCDSGKTMLSILLIHIIIARSLHK